MVRIIRNIEGILYRGKKDKKPVVFLGKDNDGRCVMLFSIYNFDLPGSEEKLTTISTEELEETYEPVPETEENLDYYYTRIK